ncbi:MAG TPA: glycosyl hydrolase family 79 C-terminal domain-containing protein [bacterium]|nr:glycosyl hydrolase family 79 C-terminal domain-containing protein [bacterium]
MRTSGWLRYTAAAVAVVCVVCLSGSPSPATGDPSEAGGSGEISILVSGLPLGADVPGDFLGLSFETSALADNEFAADRPVLVRLFANLGTGVVRFGGNTLDQSAWTSAGAFEGATSTVTPADLQRMFDFTRQAGWKVLLGLDLGHYDPEAAADEAAMAARLGARSLDAFEFGNEPDLYVRTYAGALRPSSYSVPEYLHEWQEYLRAVRRRVPNARVVGPSIAGTAGGVEILRQLAEAEHDEIEFATSHHYPLGAPITDLNSPAYASIPNLVSPALRAREVEEIGGWVRTVTEVGQSLRLTETNSVFGGGKHGVSDTLAGALWTVDYMFRVAQLGVIGINLHATIDRCGGYTPICASTLADAQADRVHVQPNYYALLLFHLAAQGRFIPTKVAPNARVTAYATRGTDGLTRITVVNFGAQAATVRIRVIDAASSTTGSLIRLLGPSLDATEGVTLGGRVVAADGTVAMDPPEPVAFAGGVTRLDLPGASATVLTLSK